MIEELLLPIAEWCNAAQPRTWLSHSAVWLFVQLSGSGLDGLAVLLGWSLQARLFQVAGYGAGLVFYGQRELLDFSSGLTAGNLAVMGDSLLDFLLPALVNTLLLVTLLRAAREARQIASTEASSNDPEVAPDPATS